MNVMIKLSLLGCALALLCIMPYAPITYLLAIPIGILLYTIRKI